MSIKVIKQLIAVEESGTICECHRKRQKTEGDDLLDSLAEKYGFPKYNPTHYVRTKSKSVKCIKCGNHWCCDECAIEDDAIPGFLSDWRGFKRRIDKKNKNIRNVTCMKCEHWEPKE